MIEINGQEIGTGKQIPVIAEIGINHNGSVELGKELIDAAASAGASGVKFQTYKTEKRFEEDAEFYDVFERMELDRKDEKRLWEHAHNKDNLLVLSTPFDPESASLCKQWGADALKIASFETTNKKLVRSIANQGLPIIASTGQNRLSEVEEIVSIFDSAGIKYALLHCISSYPMSDKDANLAVIRNLSNHFDCPVGFSDHSIGSEVPGYAAAVGADLIEKHFTVDKSLEGPDHEMSANESELSEVVDEVRRVERILGSPELRVRPAEEWIYENIRRETE
jgi:sialic acid synthase SpsE